MAVDKTEAVLDDEEAEATSSRQQDPELRVIGKIIRTLNDLDEPARGRVMAYLSDRYYGIRRITDPDRD